MDVRLHANEDVLLNVMFFRRVCCKYDIYVVVWLLMMMKTIERDNWDNDNVYNVVSLNRMDSMNFHLHSTIDRMCLCEIEENLSASEWGWIVVDDDGGGGGGGGRSENCACRISNALWRRIASVCKRLNVVHGVVDSGLSLLISVRIWRFKGIGRAIVGLFIEF